jgi:glycyl-tRNA synthetase alpha subunit
MQLHTAKQEKVDADTKLSRVMSELEEQKRRYNQEITHKETKLRECNNTIAELLIKIDNERSSYEITLKGSHTFPCKFEHKILFL